MHLIIDSNIIKLALPQPIIMIIKKYYPINAVYIDNGNDKNSRELTTSQIMINLEAAILQLLMFEIVIIH